MGASKTGRLAAGLLVLLAAAAEGGPRRLVVIKADGLPPDSLERWASSTDSRTGRSLLPWIDTVFRQNGARLENFYTRGISLSAPAWNTLDTGRHLVIHGNAEYDRLTLRVYDYLNFFPFYVANARSRRADMPGVERLDEAGVALFIDQFAPEKRVESNQLLQRGVHWRVLGRGAANRIKSRSLRELFDEWQTGFEFAPAVTEQLERELIARLADEKTDYLDYYFTDYDHVGHLAGDDQSILEVLRKLDGLVGRIWTAITKSSRAGDTIFVLVSDHGMNTEPGVFSQGYNLVEFFRSAGGGGHHVILNRHPMTEYKLRGLDPFVTEVSRPSAESLYLAGQAGNYPTALLDLDGNERASVHLRSSILNEIHQLLLKGDVAGAVKRIDTRRPAWQQTADEMEQELEAVKRAIERQRIVVAGLKKKFDRTERDLELDEPPKRERAALASWERDEAGYREYAGHLRRLLALAPGDKADADRMVPHRVMGDRNTIHELANYAAGPQRTIDYFETLAGLRVRNNVQATVGARPVDLIAVANPAPSCGAEEPGCLEIFLYTDEEHQALIQVRPAGEIRYVPVARLRQDAAGRVEYERRDWAPGFPLRYFEDPNLETPGDRARWLSEWHSDRDWLAATHRTLYSNAIVGLTEQFGPPELGEDSKLWRGAPAGDVPLLKRFETRRQRMARADLLLVAANHWNFNVRGFNPGGNHGSFFRISTHSTWMMAGAGIRAGQVVAQPYDALSFVPTLLRLAGIGTGESYPGRVVRELLP